MLVRILAILFSLPLVLIGFYGLAVALAPDVEAVEVLQEHVEDAVDDTALEDHLERIEDRVAGGVLALAGLLLLGFGLKPRGDQSDEAPAAPPAAYAPASVMAPAANKRVLRKVDRRAAVLAKQGAVLEAAELCAESGLHDAAAGYFTQVGEFVRAAEVRQDQNRMIDAADLYQQAGDFDAAGSLLASQNEHGQAGDCYRKGGRLSVAAEMYEKAGRHADAAQCYADTDFHRYAAQAWLKVEEWQKAARALEEALKDEAASASLHVGDKEHRKTVLQTAKLYEQSGDLDSAMRVLVAGECFAAAGEMAMRSGMFEQAADHFQRGGDAPKAAEALRALGEEAAAAQLMGEHLRDKGDNDEAARLLVEAGDFGSAGDLYRQLEDYPQAGECFERGGDSSQAAEMFRLAGAWARALVNYERVNHFQEAAECAAQTGDNAKRAELLARAGLYVEAGEVHAGQGLEDEAIKVLQQVPVDHDQYQPASAMLGRIFGKKKKFGLAIQKLQQAIGERELDARNIALFYDLATVFEAAGKPADAMALYERILGADYHYKDVEERLETTRALAQAMPSAEGGSQSAGTNSDRPGRYLVVSELGRGGMGIVYKAEDTVLDRPVAFKVLPDALRDNPQALQNFLREAKSAASLNHPNIVTVYDAGEQDGRYYIAMEYVDGTTLKEIVRRRGAIAPKGVIHVILQMCEALQYAHEHKIVHRDIKTANTMWARDKKAKIMDFGLAKVVEEVRNHTTLVSGTPYYMSPEQTLGKNVDHRTDLYSLGVTIFELATGALPFTEGNVPYHHVHTAPPDPREVNPELPEALAQLIIRCLQKDPADRPQQARDIAAQIKQDFSR
jgi:tetratricopeptide (TPR) repeat protein